jgi:hypothetical protein
MSISVIVPQDSGLVHGNYGFSRAMERPGGTGEGKEEEDTIRGRRTDSPLIAPGMGFLL